MSEKGAGVLAGTAADFTALQEALAASLTEATIEKGDIPIFVYKSIVVEQRRWYHGRKLTGVDRTYSDGLREA